MGEIVVPLIVLATDDPEAVERVQEAFAAVGWEVEAVRSRDEALSFRPGRVPDLVLVEERTPVAEDLVRTYSRVRGGPGVVLLRRESAEAELPPGLQDVDAVVREPYTAQELIETVRTRLSLEPSGRDVDGLKGKQRVYTTEEIFGDILSELAELGEEPERPEIDSGSEGLASQQGLAGREESLEAVGESFEGVEESFEGKVEEPPQVVNWVGAAPEAPPESEGKEPEIAHAASIEGPLKGDALVRTLAELRSEKPEKPMPPQRPTPPEKPPPPAARAQGSERILPMLHGAQGARDEIASKGNVADEVDWMLAAVVEESQSGAASRGISSDVPGDESAAVDSLLEFARDDIEQARIETSLLRARKSQSVGELVTLSQAGSEQSREERSAGLSDPVERDMEESGSQVLDQPVRMTQSRWSAFLKAVADPLEFVGRYRASGVGSDAPHFLGGDSIDE